MGTEHEHKNHDEQRHHVLQLGVDDDRRQVDYQTNYQRTEECPIRGAKAAEGYRGEDQQQDAEAEIPFGLVEGEERTAERCSTSCLLYTSDAADE